MAKKITPICSCPHCWKALELLEQETFQTTASKTKTQIKYFTMQCKDCAIEDYFDEDEEKIYERTRGDRTYVARVELTETPINWQPRQKIVKKGKTGMVHI